MFVFVHFFIIAKIHRTYGCSRLHYTSYGGDSNPYFRATFLLVDIMMGRLNYSRGEEDIKRVSAKNAFFYLNSNYDFYRAPNIEFAFVRNGLKYMISDDI